MSEKKPFDMENTAAENAEEVTEVVETAAEAAEATSDRENAPRAAETAEAAPAPEKPKAKKRKRTKVTLRLTALLLVFALLFGVVLGFALGRNKAKDDLIEARIAIDELTAHIAAMEEAQLADVEGLSDENIDALNLLAGEGSVSNVVEESFLGDDEVLAGYENGTVEPVVVAEFKGGALMSDEAAAAYNDAVAGYIFSGYTEEEVPESLLEETLASLANEKIMMLKAQELGVYELSDADRAEIAREAQDSYNELIGLFRGFVDPSGKDESAVIEETKLYLAESEGITLESVTAMLSESWWQEKMYNKVVENIKIENTDILNLYNEKLEAQKTSFSEYPENFEASQMGGETIVYNLPGYRAVKLLSITADEIGAAETAAVIEEEIAGIDPSSTTDAPLLAQYQAELDALYAAPEAAMQAVLQQIEGGADFDAMLSQYGEDIGMLTEEIARTGYYVSRDSLLWPKQMIDAAMSLKTAGDISEPFRMNGSVCILEYIGEVPSGVISIDLVYDAVSAEALDLARMKAYDEQAAKWMEEAEVKYYPERMR